MHFINKVLPERYVLVYGYEIITIMRQKNVKTNTEKFIKICEKHFRFI